MVVLGFRTIVQHLLIYQETVIQAYLNSLGSNKAGNINLVGEDILIYLLSMFTFSLILVSHTDHMVDLFLTRGVNQYIVHDGVQGMVGGSPPIIASTLTL